MISIAVLKPVDHYKFITAERLVLLQGHPYFTTFSSMPLPPFFIFLIKVVNSQISISSPLPQGTRLIFSC